MDKRELIPVGENAGSAIERVLDAWGRSDVSLAECLDADATALCADDMRWFPSEYFGRVPTYSVFMRYVNALPIEQRVRFKELVSEIESERSVKAMAGIAGSGSVGLEEVRRFNMYKDLNKVAEKRLDRIERQRASAAGSATAGADLAARIISALSDADLLKIKGQAEAIDAEYKEVADGQQTD